MRSLVFEEGMGVLERELPTLDVMSEDFASDPHRVLAALPAGTVVARSERGLEVLSYRACQEAFSSTCLTQCAPELMSAFGVTNREALRFAAEDLVSQEGAEHTRLRSAVVGFFTAVRLQKMRASATELVTEVIASAEQNGRCDVVRQIGVPAAARFFCRVIGVPDSDAELVHRFSVGFFSVLRADQQPTFAEFRDTIDDYLLGLLRKRRSDPGDDLVSYILHAESSGNHSRAESLRLAITALGTSTETLVAQIALMIGTLIEHPGPWKLLRERADLVPGAVLECVRLRPVVFATERIARQDTELCGVPVRQGEFLFLHIIAANRDPAIYREPGQLDIARPVTYLPLTWGIGRHFCFGRGLSVLVMEEVLRVIRTRWKAMRYTAAPTTVGQPYSVRPVTMPIAVDQAQT